MNRARRTLPIAVFFAFVSLAAAQTATQTLRYPSEGQTIFTIKALQAP